MGKYVDGALLPNEAVVAEARPHWAMFVAPGLVFLLGIFVIKAGSLLVAIAMIWGLYRLMVYNSTEMALTNKRVIAKSGIVRRNVVDVSNGKIEGLTYHQGILGRIFGFGSVMVRGTGIGQVPVPFIADPDRFKHEVGRVLHA